MILRKTIYNDSVKLIEFDEKKLDEMAEHLIGIKLSKFRESVYDADGDGKVSLKDFVHRIKNLAGAEPDLKIKPKAITTTPGTSGGGY